MSPAFVLTVQTRYTLNEPFVCVSIPLSLSTFLSPSLLISFCFLVSLQTIHRVKASQKPLLDALHLCVENISKSR